MQRSDFHFELPPELIAQRPLAERCGSRLLVLDPVSRQLVDRQFSDIADLLVPGDLLVFNDTRVIPARLFGAKASGGKIEVLVERVVNDHHVLAQIRASKSPKPGALLLLEGGVRAEVLGRQEDLFELRFLDTRPVVQILEAVGHIPLPPYIERSDDVHDRQRYQTVYARRPGAVAAPTAGLHFDQALIDRLRDKGIESAFVTLHVGAGTFQPVRVDDLTQHRMHAERVEVSVETCAAIERTRQRQGRVVAIGTTAVRSLESAVSDRVLRPFQGETRLFITPGYRFQVVDCLVTNFHLPESTLLMLVCAFGGYEPVMAAYRHAVHQGYRFFSYGDAMFLCRNNELSNKHEV